MAWAALPSQSLSLAAVYAWRTATLGFAAMHRLVALVLALGLLALPSAALAQSAGDEQYADPFGEVEQPNDAQEEPAPAPEPAHAPEPAGDQPAVASQEPAAPTLPRTGLPAAVLAALGGALMAGGGVLRRRTS